MSQTYGSSHGRPADSFAVESPLTEQHRHAQKLAGIGRFANVFAHDFNNLLTVIHAYTELALRDQTLSGRLREQLQAIRAAADSAAWLSRQLLTHSRRDAGKPAVVDVNLMLREVHQLVQRSLPSVSAAELRLQEALPPVLADPGPLSELLLATVSHVMLQLPAGGRLLIESTARAAESGDGRGASTRAETDVCVRVSGGSGDTTHGEWADVAPNANILDDFGVSLAASREIIDALHGELTVARNGQHGWTIDISLPGASVLATGGAGGVVVGAGAAVRPSAPVVGVPHRGVVVLLVEADDAVRRSVAALLRAQHCEVISAASGDEALRTSALNPAAVEVLLTTPTPRDMPLTALAAAVRRRSPAVRTVVMSGRAETPAAADVRLDKPFVAEALAAALAAALHTGPRVAPDRFPPLTEAGS